MRFVEYIVSLTASPMSDSNKLKRVGLRGEKENEKAEKDDQSEGFGDSESELLQLGEEVAEDKTHQTRSDGDEQVRNQTYKRDLNMRLATKHASKGINPQWHHYLKFQ